MRNKTNRENTILSSYAATRLLGIISNYLSQLFLCHKPNIYIYIGRLVLGIIILVEFGFLILLVFGLEEWIGLGNSSHTRPTSTAWIRGMKSIDYCFLIIITWVKSIWKFSCYQFVCLTFIQINGMDKRHEIQLINLAKKCS